MAKALMIQGTGSGAGKSLIAAAMCRIFRDLGIDVAPFKAQNMALNSSITVEGGEIGRAQALQARAARVESTNDMNPVLLKVSGETGSQVILHGKVHATMKAREYYAFRDEAWRAVEQSYARLSKQHDLIVIEGAGSPAEINLMNVDIVNMAMARHARAPVLLVGDIDKGGVFASLYGTVKLLGRDSRYIKGFVINKFRGDRTILDPGLDMIRERTGKPVIGVLPYIHDIGLPEEDGLALSQRSWQVKRATPAVGSQRSEKETIKIVVVRLKYISNFTDFDPLAHEPDVELVYSADKGIIENADCIILPGSKNTVKDLLNLGKSGIAESIKRVHDRGIPVMGMCGGYQMLGKKIFDPFGVESPEKEMDGLGLLNIETTFGSTKTTCRVEAVRSAEWNGRDSSESGVRSSECNEILHGYEIHMGTSTGDIGLFKLRRLSSHSALSTPHSARILDGSRNGTCWGTYLHGIFENDAFRRDIVNGLRERKGLPALQSVYSYHDMQEQAIDALAGVVRANLDMDFIRKVVGL